MRSRRGPELQVWGVLQEPKQEESGPHGPLRARRGPPFAAAGLDAQRSELRPGHACTSAHARQCVRTRCSCS